MRCDTQHGGGTAESSRKADDRADRRRRPHTAVAECRTELKFTMPLTYLAVDMSMEDLTAEDTEVIVNPANRYLRHGAGAAKAIATAAGPGLITECTEFIKAYEMLPIAHVTHTSAGNLPSSIKYVIHAVGPNAKETPDLEQCLELLRATFLNCLLYANDVLCAKSIAMPAISSGIFGVPMNIVSAAIAYAIQSFDRYLTTLTPDRENLGHVKFVNIDRWTTEQLIDGLRTHLARDLLSESAGTDGAGSIEYTDTESDSDTTPAGTAEYLPMRGTTDNDRPAVADRQQDTGSVRHALADVATNRFDADCVEVHKSTESKTGTIQNDTKRYTSKINNFINGKRQPATFPSVNAIVNEADARGETPTANEDDDEDGNRPPTTDDAEVTLQTQHTDKDLAYMIDYLQHGTLLDDNKTERRMLLTKDNFAILDDKLIHIGIKRQKNNGTDQPIAEQLCIPKQLQPTLLAQYHAQLMHCGYEKMYLTMKQRIYWSNMYTDVRNYVTNCETCKTAKADNHPVRAKIHCREVSPEIFQRVHIDHLKISVKGATHGYTHALVMIDAM